MADAGVVALDPVRLAGLEHHLDSLSSVCLRRAGAVADELAGIGEAAPGEVEELRRVAGWCRVQAEGVAGRRRIIEGLPSALPPPGWALTNRQEARARADRLARELLEALRPPLAGLPPEWDEVVPLLAAIGRGAHSEEFSERLRYRLGDEVLLSLAPAIERSAARARGPFEPVATSQPLLDRCLTIVRDLVAGAHPRPPATSGPGRGALPPWSAAVAGFGIDLDDDLVAQVREGGQRAGLAADVVTDLVRGVRTFAAATAPARRASPLAALELVRDLKAAVTDPTTVNVLATVSSGLAVAAPLSGPLAPALWVGAAVVAFVAWAESLDQPDDARDVRIDDDGDGTRTYPSGSASNPNVDEAGVPRDARYG